MTTVHLTDLLQAYQQNNLTVKNLEPEVLSLMTQNTKKTQSKGAFLGDWNAIRQDFVQNGNLGTTPSQLFEHDLNIAEIAKEVMKYISQNSVVCAISIGNISSSLYQEMKRNEVYKNQAKCIFNDYDDFQQTPENSNSIYHIVNFQDIELSIQSLLEKIFSPLPPLIQNKDTKFVLKKIYAYYFNQHNNIKQTSGIVLPKLTLIFDFNACKISPEIMKIIFQYSKIPKIKLVLIFYSINSFTQISSSFRAIAPIQTMIINNQNTVSNAFIQNIQNLIGNKLDQVSILSLYQAYLTHKTTDSPTYIILKHFLQLQMTNMQNNNNSLLQDSTATNFDAVFLNQILAEIQSEQKQTKKITKISLQNIQDELISLMKAETALCSKIGIKMVEICSDGGFYVPCNYSSIMKILERVVSE